MSASLKGRFLFSAFRSTILAMPAGRPSIYSPEIADKICERLATGETLRSIGNDDDLPSTSTIERWRDKDADFDGRCARAIERGIDRDVDGMKDIESLTLAGKYDPAASRAVLSSIQWRASKRFPKRYGDRLSTEVSGPGGGAVKTEMVVKFVDTTEK